MHSAESPSMSETYNESDVASHDGGRNSFDEHIRIAPEGSHYDERLRWARSDASQHSPYAENNRAVSKKPSFVKRMVRATARFVVAVLIGVGGTFAWQAYGDQARTMLATMDPSLAWLAPLPAAVQPSPAAAPAVSSADLAQQLQPMAQEIAAVRHDLEQLAAKQEQLATNQGQMAQGLAAVQAMERDIGLKISSVTAPKPAHPQQPPHHAVQLQPHQPTQLQPHEAAQRAAQPPEPPEQR